MRPLSCAPGAAAICQRVAAALAAGDGRWVVAIRGAQLAADRLSAVAQAGGDGFEISGVFDSGSGDADDFTSDGNEV